MDEPLPLVSIVTPVYNGEEFLAECIESVLRQEYENWEYIVADNGSTDRTRGIAEAYAGRNGRISVHAFEEHVDVIGSHNRALRLISPRSKYCKVVSADDVLFPECISRMVEVAENHPSIGIVGSYTIAGARLKLDGLPYGSSFIRGRNICRWHLLDRPFVFGAPTSVLYRADLVRSAGDFYPQGGEHPDTSACYRYLRDADFGFVHQVLSLERIHPAQISTRAMGINSYISSILQDLLEFGPVYLTRQELDHRRREVLRDYYDVLAQAAVHFRGREFWTYHSRKLRELGCPFSAIRFAAATARMVFDLLLNPKQTVHKLMERVGAGRKDRGGCTDSDILRAGSEPVETRGRSR